MRIRFQIHLSSGESFPWEHEGPRLSIGRMSECDLSFRGPVGDIVSGRHAVVELSATGATLSDLRSTNGTFLNGVRLTGPAAIKAGDQILLGQAGPRLDVLSIETSASPASAPDMPPPLSGGRPTPGEPPATPLPAQLAVPSSGRRLVLACTGAAAAVVLLVGGIWMVGRMRIAEVEGRPVAEAGPKSEDPATRGPSKETVDRRPVEPPEPLNPEPPPTPPATLAFDEKPWMSADLVLVNPVHYAVAIEQSGQSPTYTVSAKADGEAAVRAAETAWQSGVSIIADEPLTRRIHARVNQGDVLGEVETKDLNGRWREFRIVPRNGTVVVFNDLKQRRTRLGFLAPASEFDPSQPEEPWFRDVRGRQPEPFQREYVQVGTLRKGLSDDVLASTPGLDFLDYCLYHLASVLTTPPDRRDALKVYVVGDVSHIARSANREDMLKHYPTFSPREDHERMRSEADRLVRESERLASELRARLNDLGVPVAEWSKEMAFGSYDTDFRRPAFQQAQDSNLLGVSHVLLFRVRTPQTHGMYELSMRLVDVERGQVKLERQGDRLKEESIDPAGSPYLRHTGELALLELNAERADINETRVWAKGGVPLLVPPIKVGAAPAARAGKSRPETLLGRVHNSRAEMWGQQVRLGYLESQLEEDPVLFRDLFSSHIQMMPREAVSGIEQVETDSEVPPAHEMRYLVWRLAKLILPTAGRVAEVNEQRVKTTLSRRDGIKPGDRLTALRLSDWKSSEASASEMRLPQELIVTDVTDVDSVANIERLEGQDLEESLSIGINDVVHRRPPRKIVVGVLKPKVGGLEYIDQSGARIPRSERADIEKATQWVGDQLGQMLQNAMVKLRLPVVERSELQDVIAQQKNENFDINPALAANIGRVTGATHVILGEVSPGLYNEMRVGLRVVEVDTGMVMEQINFKFKRSQFEYWTP
ncbi:MAG: FHA domain-containing protein [Pirellulales bacterium]|nr:FHA domain-containing protein [Pirellulales bacterium]